MSDHEQRIQLLEHQNRLLNIKLRAAATSLAALVPVLQNTGYGSSATVLANLVSKLREEESHD